MDRKYIAAGNWKMHTLPQEGAQLASAITDNWNGSGVELIVAPPYIHLPSVLKVTENSAIQVAAQNCHFAAEGAFTGEVSPIMLKALGVPYVIIGHSERREYFHENNSIVRDKVNAVLEAGMQCIFCCGEPLNIRESGRQGVYVQRQVEQGLLHLDDAVFSKVIIAYEPVWAIGTGKTATPEQAQSMHAHIRRLVADRYGDDAAGTVPILYGGSVKPGNAPELFVQPDVDGGLIGGASLDADSFIQIASALSDAKS